MRTGLVVLLRTENVVVEQKTMQNRIRIMLNLSRIA